jgi:putative tryptophan/tyrosine transport system substrate-binding protein
MSHSPAFATAICLLLTCAAAAQTSTKTARIGMLCPVQCAGAGYVAFDAELRKLGWVEGSNLIIEREGAEGRYERLPGLAANLARSKPNLIIAAGSQAARAAKDATAEIPVAFSFVAHPVELGLVRSLGRPGGNVTGVAALTPGAFLAKQFEVLRELLPRAQHVAVLHNPANDDARLALSGEVPMVSQQFGWRIDVIEVRVPEEIPGAIAQAKTLGADGLLVLGDAMLNTPPNRVSGLAVQAGLPALHSVRDPVLVGGLLSYTPNPLAIARRHAQYVDRILRGASPAEMPVEQPTEYLLIINLKTAKALGVTVPASLLSQANEVIE